MSIKFAVVPPNAGDIGDPATAAGLASLAEDSGWDGFFTWDSLPTGRNPAPTHDPFILLSAAASATTTIRIGTCILVAARYPAHLLAMRLASIDRLSGGRLIIGVGLGDGPSSFEPFGMPSDPKSRAAMLDEHLDIISRLWAGERVSTTSRYTTIDSFELSAPPIQQPRIPIWVGGDSPGALRRAARWDGWIGPDNDPFQATLDDLAAVRTHLESLNPDRLPTIAWAGRDTDPVALASHGATWHLTPVFGTVDEAKRFISNGPHHR